MTKLKLRAKKMNKEKIEAIENIFTKEQLIKLYSDLNKSHIKLVKWLYDNYKPILREWEMLNGLNGKLRIEFASEKLKEAKE